MGVGAGIAGGSGVMIVVGFVLTVTPVVTTAFFGLITTVTYPFVGIGILLISLGVGGVVFGGTVEAFKKGD